MASRRNNKDDKDEDMIP
jgi:hypothetical protein